MLARKWIDPVDWSTSGSNLKELSSWLDHVTLWLERFHRSYFFDLVSPRPIDTDSVRAALIQFSKLNFSAGNLFLFGLQKRILVNFFGFLSLVRWSSCRTIMDLIS